MSKRREVVHRGVDYHRVEWDRDRDDGPGLEAALADTWEEENVPVSWLNQGHGVLQNLMFIGGQFGFAAREVRYKITARDAVMAATAVQWLGTNCGRSFLETACKKAGYRLLSPREVNHEEEVRRREREVQQQWKDVREVQATQRQREQEIQLRADEVGRREARFEEQKRNWFAMMLLASIGRFKRTAPGRRGRRIDFAETE